MKKTNRLIMGSALGLAAIAVAIDHTRHRLPDPVAVSQEQVDISDEDNESPCGLDSESSPCSMDSDDDSDSSPCGLGD